MFEMPTSGIGGDMVRLDLTEDEAHALRVLFHDYLPDLRREVARTEDREFRHELVKRQDLCERLLGELERADAHA
jgi:hypothetical protein